MSRAFHVQRPVPVLALGCGPSHWSARGDEIQFCNAVGWLAEPLPACYMCGAAFWLAYPGALGIGVVCAPGVP